MILFFPREVALSAFVGEVGQPYGGAVRVVDTLEYANVDTNALLGVSQLKHCWK